MPVSANHAQDGNMFDQAILASDAMREAARAGNLRLLPALSGCRSCNAAQMIASPVLGRCAECDAQLDVLHSTEPAPPNN